MDAGERESERERARKPERESERASGPGQMLLRDVLSHQRKTTEAPKPEWSAEMSEKVHSKRAVICTLRAPPERI